MKFNKNVTASRRKNRKAHFTSIGLERTKLMNAPLSKDLKEEYGIKRIAVRPGDMVKVVSGEFKKKEGVVMKVNRHDIKIEVEGCFVQKEDGKKINKGIHPSNLRIIKLSMEKDRAEIINKKVEAMKSEVKA
ncbi:60S ribosomal protein L26 [Spraguea lophii 42_110]|uniref:60S ribosomal protein L26 n=1 Tax=Spraguea lophii (strain 42_110) TaxID=1358809 RepID=S7W884_SPRLO|nr:Chain LY0, 60S ribosomal protein L26 [Spraguea lophii 42_110]7QJH_KY0 Chain KY0, 60S ribosomal protein L26 [Spraguea lophii 42_110]7QJH_LY0 Chain LY0, 60S ribosomal protein L26 [Spraguea lophii 42_110]8BR3_LY0 Chain LY0, 60S ribosomal protein L26 [Spraguea lophii 42_110]8P5D_LY0 Chain LY0, 60S ribosomal protein L26 [Spraguea lophii 42_110]8P60_KY0 Chain KY0, 60S ribosomal protein L26 [Spraguea lophii 42_110]8P60_LY0 Chain LY0, 60S ribosomal protein L26 [Spraguea lophii 42_110]EPR79051.1 6